MRSYRDLGSLPIRRLTRKRDWYERKMNSTAAPLETKYPESQHDAAYWKTRPIEERSTELEALRQEYIQTLPLKQQKFQRVISFIGRLRDAP